MPPRPSKRALALQSSAPSRQSTQSAAPSSQSTQTSTSAFLAEIASATSQSDQDAERKANDDFHGESVRMTQELAEARHRRQASEAHAQLRQLEEEKLKAKAAKAQARNQRKVLCFCAAKVLSDLLLPRAVTKTDAHTHDADAVAHGPCSCLLFCQSAK